ncbi:MAG: response regulator [Gammaproteobacteria bacterium]|nr:response regulator [Gammaproteobacteria bacterium]
MSPLTADFEPRDHRVLVVDDEPELRKTLVLGVAEQGYEVTEAVDGTDALEQIGQTLPDLVLLGAMMPQLDGYDTCIKIRLIADEHTLPILMLTVPDDAEAISRGFDVGVTDFIPKPFNWALLFQRIHQHLQRVSTTRQLVQSEQRLNRAISNTNDGIWDWDLKTNQLYLSPNWKAMLGYQDHEFESSFINWQTIIHPLDLGRFLWNWTQHADNNSTIFRIDYRLRRKQGDYQWCACRGKMELGDDGEPTRMSGFQTDISERKSLERQLNQAQKMQAIGQLTGGIAHDFNNILVGITGFCDLSREQVHAALDKDPEDPTLQDLERYLEHIHSAGNRAKELIQHMLTYSHGGDTEANLFDLQGLVKDILPIIRNTLPTSIYLHTYYADGGSPALINAINLQQILMNLCVNARDAMGGRGHIHIRIGEIYPEGTMCASCHALIQGEFVYLEVKDEGRGINKDIAQNIFRPFFTSKEIGQGSGMGLSVIHGIVHGIGGHITVQSAADVGSTFRVLLPTFKGDALHTPKLPLNPAQQKSNRSSPAGDPQAIGQ